MNLQQALILIKAFLALLLCGAGAVLFYSSRNYAIPFDKYMDRYGFRMSVLASLGFYLTERIPYSFNSRYDQRIRGQLIELFGHREIDSYFAVHLAQKVSLTISTLVFFLLVYLLGGAEKSFLVLGFLVAGLVYYWADKELEKKIKHRKREMLLDLPELINTLTLLINAGLPFARAMQKVVSERDFGRPLFRELSYTLAEINAGKPTFAAYEELAQRCKVHEITRLVSAILQNINRGSSDQVQVLKAMAAEAWEKRKEIARKKGEEASSKIVFPMVMVFLAISIIVLAPAMMTMAG